MSGVSGSQVVDIVIRLRADAGNAAAAKQVSAHVDAIRKGMKSVEDHWAKMSDTIGGNAAALAKRWEKGMLQMSASSIKAHKDAEAAARIFQDVIAALETTVRMTTAWERALHAVKMEEQAIAALEKARAAGCGCGGVAGTSGAALAKEGGAVERTLRREAEGKSAGTARGEKREAREGVGEEFVKGAAHGVGEAIAKGVAEAIVERIFEGGAHGVVEGLEKGAATDGLVGMVKGILSRSASTVVATAKWGLPQLGKKLLGPAALGFGITELAGAEGRAVMGQPIVDMKEGGWEMTAPGKWRTRNVGAAEPRFAQGNFWHNQAGAVASYGLVMTPLAPALPFLGRNKYFRKNIANFESPLGATMRWREASNRANQSEEDVKGYEERKSERERLAKERAEQTEKRHQIEKGHRETQRAVAQATGSEALAKYDSRELFEAQMAVTGAQKQFDRERKQAAIPDYANLAGNLDRLLEAQKAMVEHDKDRVEQLNRQKEAQAELLRQTREQVDAAKKLAQQSNKQYGSKLSGLGAMSAFDRAAVHQIAQRVKAGHGTDADMRKLRELGLGSKVTDPYFKRLAGKEGDQDLEILGEKDEAKSAEKNVGKVAGQYFVQKGLNKITEFGAKLAEGKLKQSGGAYLATDKRAAQLKADFQGISVDLGHGAQAIAKETVGVKHAVKELVKNQKELNESIKKGLDDLRDEMHKGAGKLRAGR